ncbi:MAG: tetratricopeptide repeat protein [Hyphomicrobiales bacterium]
MFRTLTSSPARVAVICAGLALGSPGSLAAAEKAAFSSATEAYRSGLTALAAGRTGDAVTALGVAAEGGVIGARLKLADIYAHGTGVQKDAVKAFEYYRSIADQYADISPRHPIAPYVAKAFVALAGYYREGIPGRDLAASPARASRLLHHAASYFGDAEAQYQLARMYLTGEGVNRNPRLAVNWLANASQKQHAASQALLGDLLWRGIDDIQRQPLKGLALLSLARQNAAGSEDAEWIEEVSAKALSQAEPNQLELASRLYDKWRGPADRAPNMASAPAIAFDAAGLESLNPAPVVPVEAVATTPVPEASAAPNAAVR